MPARRNDAAGEHPLEGVGVVGESVALELDLGVPVVLDFDPVGALPIIIEDGRVVGAHDLVDDQVLGLGSLEQKPAEDGPAEDGDRTRRHPGGKLDFHSRLSIVPRAMNRCLKSPGGARYFG